MIRVLIVAAVLGIICAMLFPLSAKGQTQTYNPLAQTECIPIFDCPKGFAGLDTKRTNTGWHVWWWAKVDDSHLRFVHFACRHGTCLDSSAFGDRIRNLKLSADPKTAARSDISSSLPLLDCTAQAQLCTEREQIRTDTYVAASAILFPVAASAPQPPPPPPPPPPEAGWTAYGGTIFKVVNGRLASVVSGKTATKGAPCVGVTIVMAGTFTYMQLAGGPADEATRCVKP